MGVKRTTGSSRALVAGAAAVYAAGLAWSLVHSWALAMAPLVLGLAAFALSWWWWRLVDARGVRPGDALVPLLALYALPFVRLLFWNAASPVPEALFDAARQVELLVSGGWNPRHLSLPRQALVLAVRLVPFILLGAAWALVPLAAGGGMARAARTLGRRLPRPAAAALAGAALVLAAALAPVACDTHESWNDVPNARCSCVGLLVEDYPPGVSDGTSTDRCIGLERPPV